MEGDIAPEIRRIYSLLSVCLPNIIYWMPEQLFGLAAIVIFLFGCITVIFFILSKYGDMFLLTQLVAHPNAY